MFLRNAIIISALFSFSAFGGSIFGDDTVTTDPRLRQPAHFPALR
jgi:hypothetical protein